MSRLNKIRENWITLKSYELAEAKYDKDYYMLSDKEQTDVFNLAMEMWDDKNVEQFEKLSNNQLNIKES